MTSRKVIELFYDVVSPYSWLGFEVAPPPGTGSRSGESREALRSVLLVFTGAVPLQTRVEHRTAAASCFSGGRHARIRCLRTKLCMLGKRTLSPLQQQCSLN